MGTVGKKRYSIDELRAFKLAYGRSIQGEDYLINIILPAILGGVMAHLLLHYILLTIAMTIFGGIYGYFVLFPANIKRFYERKSFEQRNKFVNNITQVMSAPSITVYVVLNDMIDLYSGEFKERLIVLVSQLSDASTDEYHEYFQQFASYYDKDVIFTQYIDILETSSVEGTNNLESLKKTTSFHNDIKKFRNMLVENKNRALKYAKAGHSLILLLIMACHFRIEPITFENYLKYFSHHPIGWGVSIFYLIGVLYTMTHFMKTYFDDDVLEVDM